MRPRNTLVAVAILAVLGAFYYWHEVRQAPARKEKEAAATRFLPLPQDAEVRGVEVRNAAGEFRLELQEGAGWRLRAPLEVSADDEQARGVVEAMRGLSVRRRPKDTGEASQYGLSPPAATVTLRPGSGEPVTFEVGAKVPVGDGFFARLSGSSEVVVVGGEADRAVSLKLDALRDHRAVKLDSWAVDRVRVEAGGRTLALERRADGAWSLTSPIAFPADREIVREMVDDVCGLRAAAFDDAVPPASGLLLPAAVLVLAASEGGKEERVEVGAKVEGQPRRYLRRGDGSVIEVDEAFMKHVDRPTDDLRRRQVLGVDRWTVTRVELAGVERRVMEKAADGGEWKLTDPAKRDLGYEEASGLLDALYDLKAERFLATAPDPVRRALDTPALTVRLEAKAGSPAAKPEQETAVLAGPLDGAVYARVEGVADLFVLAPDAIEKARQAGEKVALAAPAPAATGSGTPAASPP